TAEAVDGQGVAVVLGGDVHAAGEQVLHRVVGAAVPELQLERLRPEGAAQELVAEAYAEHGPLADQRLHGGDGVVQQRRVAGAGREYDAVRLEGEDGGRGGGAGDGRGRGA